MMAKMDDPEKLSCPCRSQNKKKFLAALLTLLGVLWTVSCTGHLMPAAPASEPIFSQHMVIVTVTRGDTFAGLAETHLSDASKAWWIAAYNGITTLSPGQRLVIPRGPIVLGGLQADGYQTVPILLYEQVTDKADGPALSAAAFEAQMAHLAHNHFTALSLDALMAFLGLGDHLPPKSILITLEGAESWVYDIAYPALKRNGLRAALFVVPDTIDRPGALTWEQLQSLAEDGFEIGLLGAVSRRSALPQPAESIAQRWLRAENELVTGREALQTRLARPCDFYAYPDGTVDDLTAALIKKQGFRAAFTRADGPNPFFSDPFRLNRQVIGGAFDLNRFAQVLITFQPAELR
jgi:peptidoglycan/xylan/chitin deacetylase (PgdA/CDA1 family)